MEEEGIDPETFKKRIKNDATSFKHRSSFVHAFYAQPYKMFTGRLPKELNNEPEPPEIVDLTKSYLPELPVVYETRPTMTSVDSGSTSVSERPCLINEQKFDSTSTKSSSKQSEKHSVKFSKDSKDCDEMSRNRKSVDIKRLHPVRAHTMSAILRGFQKAVKPHARKSLENCNTKKILSKCNPVDLKEWDPNIVKSNRTELEKRLVATRLTENEKLRLKNAEIRRGVNVIIIGAGIAGLSAADSLITAGFENVTVLEASKRLGGRIFTMFDNNNGEYLDLGVTDIDGKESWNSVHALAKEHGLVGGIHSRSFNPIMLKRRWQYNNYLCDTECRNTFNYFTGILDGQIEALRFIKSKSQNVARDIKVASSDFFRESQRRLRKSSIVMQSAIMIDPATKGVESTLKAYCKELQYHQGDCEGDANIEYFRPCWKMTSLFVKNGMKSILQPLTKRFKPNTVRYNTCVRHIDFTTFNNTFVRNRCHSGLDPTVTVTCTNGRVFKASHVIVAIPLGHLKTKARSMFCPSLSQQKLDAIDEMGFGSVGKVFLHFEQPVDRKGFELLFTEYPKNYCEDIESDHDTTADYNNDDIKFDTDILSGKRESKEMSETQTKSSSILEEEGEENNNNEDIANQTLETIQDTLLNFNSRPNSHIVQATFNGAAVEKLPDNELITELLTILQHLLSRELPKVVKVTKTAWKRNSLFRGTHPYLKPRSCPSLTDVLARPITFRCNPVIQFAGDFTHTVRTHSPLLHGARTSGVREAIRLTNFYDCLFGQENSNKSDRCVR